MSRYPIELDDDDTTTNRGPDIVITPEAETLARRPYAVVVQYDAEDGWIGRVPQIPGTLAAGDTLEEMMALLEEVKLSWIARMLEEGEEIPDPRPMEEIITPALRPFATAGAGTIAADGD